MKKIIPGAALMALLSIQTGAAEDFATAWDAADASRQEAAALGFEWRDTGKFLKQAKQAATDGDLEKAMKLVAKAHEQADDAVAQARRESNLWRARVPQ